MKLHERERVDDFSGRRAVPGGWLYIEFSHKPSAAPAHCRMSTVFVPDEDAEHVLSDAMKRRFGGFSPGERVIVAGNIEESATVATREQLLASGNTGDHVVVPVVIGGLIRWVVFNKLRRLPAETTS